MTGEIGLGRQNCIRAQDGIAVDVQVGGQAPRGRQACSGRQLAGADQVFELVGKLNVHWRAALLTESNTAAQATTGRPRTLGQCVDPETWLHRLNEKST